MHDVEDAVHDAEAEEAASGQDDSTGAAVQLARMMLPVLPCRWAARCRHGHAAGGAEPLTPLGFAAPGLQCLRSSARAATVHLALCRCPLGVARCQPLLCRAELAGTAAAAAPGALLAFPPSC